MKSEFFCSPNLKSNCKECFADLWKAVICSNATLLSKNKKLPLLWSFLFFKFIQEVVIKLADSFASHRSGFQAVYFIDMNQYNSFGFRHTSF